MLGAVAPIALASTQPTALVIDLDPNGPQYPSERSLRDLVRGGARSDELLPTRRGVAVLRNGGVDIDESTSMVDALIRNWPVVVLRLAAAASDAPAPIVPVRLLIPGRLFPPMGRGVYQRLWAARTPQLPADSVLIPPASRRSIAQACRGERPGPTRWARAWASVWKLPW